MKVSDIGLTTNEDFSMFDRMQGAMEAYKFERDILEHCRGNNMDRVVTAIDYGEAIRVFEGAREPIFFLIFELANCDARVHIDRQKQFDLAWCLNALHDLAVAIRQLHSGEVSHNDIKPANLLVFDEELRKLADLGKATTPRRTALHDNDVVVGDRKYAAPEVLYSNSLNSNDPGEIFRQRRSCDLYHLGSMAFYFMCGRMITPEVVRYLAPEHRPVEGGWSGSYLDVLPYWREAFGRVMQAFDAQLPRTSVGLLTPAAKALREAVLQLSEPDPLHRGHPISRLGGSDLLSTERYISLFNRLRRDLVVRQ